MLATPRRAVAMVMKLTIFAVLVGCWLVGWLVGVVVVVVAVVGGDAV